MSHRPPVHAIANNKWVLYDAAMKSADFWRSVRGRRILLTQPDAVLCGTNLDDFLAYDYVGAPWSDRPYGYLTIGNGGLSLRNRDTMVWCCENHNKAQNDNEDVFFASCVRGGARNVTEFRSSQNVRHGKRVFR
ncbi:hypothetical protein CYMTET_48011 [Cymbomonas tetramitiformis]|uniref:DUF5672 domain-containing protein n=1 Tax=Cymbomonas tetramitiformis TaxID=36881 RepID=A0AAE0BT26_9CHLO|nr:hypothetical protein CYMTET_48011 [Cymbomonas tetramitiformis]